MSIPSKTETTTLLRHPLWGQVQEAAGHRVYYFEDFLVIQHRLPLGKCWLYTPQFGEADKNEWNSIFKKVEKIAHVQRAIFWKAERMNLEIRNSKLSSISNFQFLISASHSLH